MLPENAPLNSNRIPDGTRCDGGSPRVPAAVGRSWRIDHMVAGQLKHPAGYVVPPSNEGTISSPESLRHSASGTRIRSSSIAGSPLQAVIAFVGKGGLANPRRSQTLPSSPRRKTIKLVSSIAIRSYRASNGDASETNRIFEFAAAVRTRSSRVSRWHSAAGLKSCSSICRPAHGMLS